MNREQTVEAIKVMQAAVDGKPIQHQYRRDEAVNDKVVWHNSAAPSWDWVNHEYRIKPEPMEIEVWMDADGVPKELVSETYKDIPGMTQVFSRKKFREIL